MNSLNGKKVQSEREERRGFGTKDPRSNGRCV